MNTLVYCKIDGSNLASALFYLNDVHNSQESCHHIDSFKDLFGISIDEIKESNDFVEISPSK